MIVPETVDPGKDSTPGSAPETRETQAPESAGATPSPGRLAPFALALALLAGFVSYGVGESLRTTFRPPSRLVTTMGMTFDLPTFEDQIAADRKNATLVYAALGGSIALALGLAGGLARGSIRDGAIAAAIGLVLGIWAGAAAALAFLPIYYHQMIEAQEELSHDLVMPLLVHAGVWAPCGLVAGFALAIGLRSRRMIAPAMVAGLLGGLMGAFAYEVLGATIFPDGKTSQPLAVAWGARLLANLAVASLVALVATLGATSTPRAKRPVAAEV